MKSQDTTLPVTADHTLSPASLALRWECSVMTIKRRIKSGRLQALKNGRLVRIPLSEILRYEAAARF